jgi:hypothetical protein
MRKIFCVLLFCLVSCAKTPIYTTETVKQSAPKILLQEVPLPVMRTNQDATNEDLLFYALELEQNLTLCNARLNAIKKSAE